MTTPKIQNGNEKLVALVLISLFVAWRIQCRDSNQLAKLDSMNPTDYIQHARLAYQQSYLTLFTRLLRRCGLFLVAYEILVLSIRWLRQVSLPKDIRTLEFMTGLDAILKLVALVFVMLCFAWYTQNYNSTRLAKLDSTTPAEFIQHARLVNQSPYLALFILQLLVSGLFIGSIEAITYVIGLGIPKKIAT